MKKAGSGLNNTNKILKKSKNKISSSKIKEKTSYINLASTGNNSTRSTNIQTPLFISTTLLSFEYEYVLQKLLRYLKQKLTLIQYEDIKTFLNNEINKIIYNKNTINNNYFTLDKNDSLNSINKVCKSHRNNTNNTNSINGNLYLNVNKFNYTRKRQKSNEKKLKLSYDFSNKIIQSPKSNNKPIRIVLGNITINEKAKSTSKVNYKKNYKDKYSLYSIVKSSHSHSYNNKNKINNNQSNSKSKSKSTSREHLNNNLNTNRTINTKSDNLTNNNTNINQINSSASTSKGIFNSNSINTNSNNNIKELLQKNKKVTTIKSTLIHQSQPLLNEKLFSKLTNSNNRIKTLKNNNIVYNTISNISVSKITKNISYKTEPNVSHNINISLANKSNIKNENSNSSRINSYRQKVYSKTKKSNSKKKPNKTIITINIPNQTNNILNNNNNNRENNPYNISNIASKQRNKNIATLESKNTQISFLKNEEMLKQIKNTIDDNLKIMFNFSYENFLSKESEQESKEVSREIDMNVSNENI